MKIQESVENYLETIYLLQKELGSVRSIDIASALGFSKPSVSNAMKKLKSLNFIEMENRSFITLTPNGEELAKRTYAKHRIISDTLIFLGVSKDIALEEACKMEHVISDETFNCMKKFIEHQNNDKINCPFV